MRLLRSRLCLVGLVLLLVLLQQAGLAAPEAVKVEVCQEGMYRVSYEALAKAGVPVADVTPGRIGLSCGGKPVARRLILPGGSAFGPGAALIFHGQGLDTRWTDTNVYWLTWDGTKALDMKPLPPGPQGAAAASSCPCRVHLEENHEYGYLIWAPETGELNPWFWRTIKAGGSTDLKWDLPGLVADGTKAQVRVLLRGRTSSFDVAPDHHMVAELNGARVGDAEFDGQAQAAISAAVPVASLKAEGNVLTLKMPGDTAARDFDQVYLDWIEVEYPRALKCEPTGLTFNLPVGQAVEARISDIPTPVVDVYDVSVPNEPAVAAGLAAKDGLLGLPVAAGGIRRLRVIPAEAYLTPERLLPVNRSHWHDRAAGADYIIICHDDLLAAIKPLAEYRAAQGLRIATVPLSEVYDECSGGVVSPQAIKDFLGEAYAHWPRPAPRYVLLVGDASYDPRNYLGTNVRDLLPAYPVRVYDSVETPTDSYYVCVAGDDHRADMAIGRLPVSTPDEVRLLCDKIIRFESQPAGGDWRGRVALVADHEPEHDQPSTFEAVTEALAGACATAKLPVKTLTVRGAGVSSKLSQEENRDKTRVAVTAPLLAAINDGCALVNFEGHGSYDFLSRQWVLKSQDVAGLTNGLKLPVVSLVTCFAGAFDYPLVDGGKCLAERLLLAPNGGAIAVVAPTRLGGDSLDLPFFGELLKTQTPVVGEAFFRAKDQMTSRQTGFWDRVENYNLLGDPATTLNLALTPIQPVAERAITPPPAPERVERGTDADRDGFEDLLVKELESKQGIAYYEGYAPLEVYTRRHLSDRELAQLTDLGARLGTVYDKPPYGFSGVVLWSRIRDLKRVLGPDFRWVGLADIYFRDPDTGRMPVPLPHPPPP